MGGVQHSLVPAEIWWGVDSWAMSDMVGWKVVELDREGSKDLQDCDRRTGGSGCGTLVHAAVQGAWSIGNSSSAVR